MKNIAIVIPTYNEEKNIVKLVKNIKNYLHHSRILIVDDTKNSKLDKIFRKFKNTEVIIRKNKKGRGSAVLHGLKQSLKNKHNQIFIEMDADFSHRPSELKRNIKYFLKNNCDLLIASRYLENSKIYNWSLSRRVLSKLSNFLARNILNISVSDYTNGFRIYSRRATKQITRKCGKIGDGFIVLSEILLAIHQSNYKMCEIDSIFINRVRGESSVNLNLILKSFIGLIKLWFIKKKYIK